MRPALLAAPLLLLAACTPPESIIPPPQSADTCGAGRYASLIGQPLASIDTRRVPGTVRVLTPKGVATTDHQLDRMNIHVDDRNRIYRVNCG